LPCSRLGWPAREARTAPRWWCFGGRRSGRRFPASAGQRRAEYDKHGRFLVARRRVERGRAGGAGGSAATGGIPAGRGRKQRRFFLGRGRVEQRRRDREWWLVSERWLARWLRWCGGSAASGGSISGGSRASGGTLVGGSAAGGVTSRAGPPLGESRPELEVQQYSHRVETLPWRQPTSTLPSVQRP